MTAIVIALLVAFIAKEAFNIYERSKLLNRLMAKDYAQYRYFEDKWKPDLAELGKIRSEGRADAGHQEDAEAEEKVDLSKFDEAWAEEDDK